MSIKKGVRVIKKIRFFLSPALDLTLGITFISVFKLTANSEAFFVPDFAG